MANGSYSFYCLGVEDFSSVKIKYSANDKLFYLNEKSISGDMFKLKTTFPGLIIGIGYFHGYESENEKDDDYKMGFSFDYVTGQPYIPGSSIKGILNHAFIDNKNITKSIINEQLKIEINDEQYYKLHSEIFGGDNVNKRNQDIFIDGTIDSKCSDILIDDHITPHLNPLKNPVPLKLLKIKEDTAINFRFILKDSNVIKELTKEKKLVIFKELIKTFGVGAKTNSGFGYLVEV